MEKPPRKRGHYFFFQLGRQRRREEEGALSHFSGGKYGRGACKLLLGYLARNSPREKTAERCGETAGYVFLFAGSAGDHDIAYFSDKSLNLCVLPLISRPPGRQPTKSTQKGRLPVWRRWERRDTPSAGKRFPGKRRKKLFLFAPWQNENLIRKKALLPAKNRWRDPFFWNN